jgi:hypothetical protein
MGSTGDMNRCHRRYGQEGTFVEKNKYVLQWKTMHYIDTLFPSGLLAFQNICTICKLM